jgi:hypothetical protein
VERKLEVNLLAGGASTQVILLQVLLICLVALILWGIYRIGASRD